MHLKYMKKNAVSKFPEFYYVRHMQAGLCGYEDETILVDNDAIAALGKTFNGKPVYIEHQDVDLQSMKQEAVGYVTDTWVDGTDGWLWSKIMVTDDEGHEVINKGWAVSNAYIPTQWGEGGMKHNLPYDRKVLNGEFTHLALVPSPRYEDAKIYTPDQYQARNTQLMNSLAPKTEEKKGIIMKFFKTKKEEVSSASDADTLEYTDAKGETVEVSVSEMVKALESAQKQEKTVMVNGKEMKVSDVVKAYEALNAKKNKRNEDIEEDEKDNEDDEDKENGNEDVSRDDFVNEDDEDEKENEDDEKDEKKNAHFKTLVNASRKNSYAPIAIDTMAAKLARAEKYSSK